MDGVQQQAGGACWEPSGLEMSALSHAVWAPASSLKQPVFLRPNSSLG